MSTKQDAKSTGFSPARLLSLLEKAVAKVNTYPLTADNLVVQQDVYKRLATIDAENPQADEDAYVPFAVLDCARKERDTDLRFAIELSAVGAMLSIDGAGGMFFDYETYFDDEKDAVAQLMTTLTMLSSGQMACLVTTRGGYACGSELLLYDTKSRIPRVLSTDTNYRWWWRKKDETGYETVVLRNRYLQDKLVIPKKWCMVEREKDGSVVPKGRIFATAELIPLTKQIYDRDVLETVGGHLMGKKEDEKIEDALRRHWEFWLLAVGVAGGLYAAALAGWLPHFIVQHPWVVGVVAFPVSSFFGAFIIMRKVHLQKEHPDHPWVRLDSVLRRYFVPVAMSLLPLFLFATTFFPIYLLAHTTTIVNFYDIAATLPVAYVAPMLMAVAFTAVFVRKAWGTYLFSAATILSIAAIFLVNFFGTNASDATPEPYTSIAIWGYLVSTGIAIFLGVKKLVARKAKKPAAL